MNENPGEVENTSDPGEVPARVPNSRPSEDASVEAVEQGPLDPVGRPLGAGKGAQTVKGMKRRSLILKVAATLFAQRGFDGVSMNEIGYESGVTGPAIYRYFASKEELLISIYSHLQGRFREGLASIFEQGLVGRDAVESLIELQIELATQEPEKIRVVDSEWPHLPPTEAAPLREGSRGYLNTYIMLIRDVRPDLGPEEVDATVHALLALINSVALRRGSEPPPPLIHARLRAMAMSVVFDAGLDHGRRATSKKGKGRSQSPRSNAG